MPKRRYVLTLVQDDTDTLVFDNGTDDRETLQLFAALLCDHAFEKYGGLGDALQTAIQDRQANPEPTYAGRVPNPLAVAAVLTALGSHLSDAL